MTSNTVLPLGTVRTVLKSVASDEGILNPIYEISAGSNKGDGYLSSITKVVVTDNKNKDQKLNLIIKMAPNIEAYKSTLLLRTCFKKEMYFYESILPNFIDFSEGQNSNLLVNIPRCYKIQGIASDNEYEYLVLADMKSKGFEMRNRMEQLDRDHIIVAFQQYARFHAGSYAMKKINPIMFDSMENLEAVVLDDKCLLNAKHICERCFRINNTSSDLYNSIRTCLHNLKTSYSTIKSSPSKYSVILHADCWCNNVLFRYDKARKPLEACLLDFQLCFLGSPAIDLCYFFFVSAPVDILNNYQEYLQVYHQELTEAYVKLGGNPDDLLTFDELMIEWKTYAKYGFTLALFIFRAMMCQEEEVLDYIDLLDRKIPIEDMFANRIMNHEAEIENMTRTLAEYMHKHGFFSS